MSRGGDAVVAQALDSTGGFTLVLAGLKAWLEHGIDPRLVADRFPEGIGGSEDEFRYSGVRRVGRCPMLADVVLPGFHSFQENRAAHH